ncbi:MAG: hypothetical protein A2487_14320 [Candidatus Raymondbacteria bacterium RifOxyC12_full_50_8]|uniref:Tyr recombinase domain-containing protein n=1 Tax=Candidatus Raymondbacteria bacterium RIFOXYD12_FULL_49_13 TaxID=1817890 RepID=A0A1F7F7E3_UNCRA|nr:MAG: hypothetical protein A2248_21950 [Candidatus Raymondbacteria bacterium RIFOXYA2_FULL_49_16]OGJ88430.1 MAG: hypothetical protein A2350_11330 [Candidatus Raymondbacteria bacterium RifOxyB12_full_50_8]OGJ96281.1 MAG: hypothetical protein A2453_08820 [Candidatus Raymondbacteria bacterium RIFOXYC2_FULL_50_21]OGK01805.1 MAG: hypothetical protein A2487_14320 [Candidatus Raymondbacteria bacterium RifOxyC12_full_50_8]OGK02488.1 MAG: hypothetical protein A2519_12165 [Candidatus Raymondbacteria ba
MGLIKTRQGWAIDYYRNGRRVQEYISESKTLAAQALARVKTELAQDRYFPDRPTGGEIKVSEILERYWSEHLQYRKSGNDRWGVNESIKAFGSYTLTALRKEEIERWMKATLGTPWKSRRKRKDGKPTVSAAKPATVNRILQALSAAINHGIKTEFIRGYKNPCAMVRKLPENNVRDFTIDETQFTALMRVLPDYLKPVIAFAYYTGCRKGEILNLKKADLDFFGNTAFIRDTKNDESRYVPLAPELKEVLVRLSGEHLESPYLFTHADGRRVQDLKKSWWTALKRVKLEHLHFHDLRHTALTNWHNAGHSHFLIMQASGHKTLSCFQRYLSFRNNDLQKLVLGKGSDNLETGKVVEIAKAC